MSGERSGWTVAGGGQTSMRVHLASMELWSGDTKLVPSTGSLSTTFDATYDWPNLTDGSDTTIAHTKDLPYQWMQLDFGGPKTVDRARFAMRPTPVSGAGTAWEPFNEGIRLLLLTDTRSVVAQYTIPLAQISQIVYIFRPDSADRVIVRWTVGDAAPSRLPFDTHTTEQRQSPAHPTEWRPSCSRSESTASRRRPSSKTMERIPPASGH